MDDREKRTLCALAEMVNQYLREERGRLDSLAESAGEAAIAALAEYGYMEEILEGRTFGRWTPAGFDLLRWIYRRDLVEPPFPFPKPPLEPTA